LTVVKQLNNIFAKYRQSTNQNPGIGTLRQQMEQLFDDILRTDRSTYYQQLTWAPAIKIQEAEIILKAVIDAEIWMSVSGLNRGRYGDESTQKSLFRPEFHHGQFQRIVPCIGLRLSSRMAS